ncbi:hypothetical protein LptCag_2746 [Leptospirillum ferriphilum]|uniref:Uncharacterized protein n=1 Tax=Leptospirillum ferriphilum TaxID=178606 RepID=A0A094W8A1_9BACT|nr:hypothetical protein LptCag_2746 [Leptospirillum ferriphilum]
MNPSEKFFLPIDSESLPKISENVLLAGIQEKVSKVFTGSGRLIRMHWNTWTE